MKATKKHLELYKKEVLKWMTRFKIGGWDVNFDFDEENDGVANTTWNLEGRVCAFRIARDWEKDPLTNKTIKETALHEVLHLILARIMSLSTARYMRKTELIEAQEEATNTLMNYILKK